MPSTILNKARDKSKFSLPSCIYFLKGYKLRKSTHYKRKHIRQHVVMSTVKESKLGY